MAQTPPLARVTWELSCDAGDSFAKVKGRDTVTQREYLLELPLHMLPGLAELIRDTVDSSPELFPEVVAERRSPSAPLLPPRSRRLPAASLESLEASHGKIHRAQRKH